MDSPLPPLVLEEMEFFSSQTPLEPTGPGCWGPSWLPSSKYAGPLNARLTAFPVLSASTGQRRKELLLRKPERRLAGNKTGPSKSSLISWSEIEEVDVDEVTGNPASFQPRYHWGISSQTGRNVKF